MKNKLIVMSVVSIIMILGSIILFYSNFPNNTDGKTNNIEESPSWTIIIYMSGDNHLDEMILKNLGHMKSVGSTENVNIVTLVDRKGSNNTE